MIRSFDTEPSVVTQTLHELRDVDLQQDPMRFEAGLRRLGMVLGYEASKLLKYKDRDTVTQLGVAKSQVLDDDIVLNTVLRAGIPLRDGVRDVFPEAHLSFSAAARREGEGAVVVDLGYIATPRLEDRVLIIADTMIATGTSLIDNYTALAKSYGTPTRTIIIGAIASREGIQNVSEGIEDADILVAAIDEELDHRSYIVPGLGDAGDLLYGQKGTPNL